MRVLFLAFAVLLAVLGCDDGKRNIKSYYFPVHALESGKVYVFASEGPDSTTYDYWLYQGVKTDSGLFLRATFFSPDFQIGQQVREKIVGNGALARQYILYAPDTTTGKMVGVNARIEAPNTFPFSVQDSGGIYLFHLNFSTPDDPRTLNYVIRNRRFQGDLPDFSFQGNMYPCIRFSMREVYGVELEGAAEIEGVGEEWYAEKLGLVRYAKSVAGGKIQYAFRLREIITPQELERRAGRPLLKDL